MQLNIFTFPFRAIASPTDSFYKKEAFLFLQKEGVKLFSFCVPFAFASARWARDQRGYPLLLAMHLCF